MPRTPINPPKFSLVVTFGSACDPQDLRRTLESVASQSFSDWELSVAMPQAALESARSVINHIRRTCPANRVFVGSDLSDPQSTVADLAKRGLQSSTGEFVAFVRAGDMLSSRALGRFAQELERLSGSITVLVERASPDIVPVEPPSPGTLRLVRDVDDPSDDANIGPLRFEPPSIELDSSHEVGQVDLIYSDEDVFDPTNNSYSAPFLKPAFSMERLRTQMYLGDLLAMRRTTVEALGGVRPQFGSSFGYDLALRIGERDCLTLHVPELLYHRAPRAIVGPDEQADKNQVDPESVTVQRAAMISHLTRSGFPAEVRSLVALEPHGVERPHSHIAVLDPVLVSRPSVSIVIPTGGATRRVRGRTIRLVDNAISSVLAHTSYPDYEIVVVFDATSTDEFKKSVAQLADPSILRLVSETRPFNFARTCNLGAIHSHGDVLIFLNDDTEVVTPEWVERIVMYAQQEEVGAVGARLLFDDGRIQHAGVWARNGHVHHRYAGFSADHHGYMGSLVAPQNCSAVTAACVGVEREKFDQVGGFSTLYPLAFNDVDLCYKLLASGYRNVVDPNNVIKHLESSSRNPETEPWEIDLLQSRWMPLMTADPWDHPAHQAPSCNEFPCPSVDHVEQLVASGAISTVGRSWPGTDPYQFGDRRGRHRNRLHRSHLEEQSS